LLVDCGHLGLVGLLRDLLLLAEALLLDGVSGGSGKCLLVCLLLQLPVLLKERALLCEQLRVRFNAHLDAELCKLVGCAQFTLRQLDLGLCLDPGDFHPFVGRAPRLSGDPILDRLILR